MPLVDRSAVTLAIGSQKAHRSDPLVAVGRGALATQGVLYGVVGLLAAKLADGDHQATPSQRGAIAQVAAEPYGRVLVFVLAAGLAAHCGWRITLAVRGEPGQGDDGGSLAKRAANLGRAAVYGSFTVAAVKLLLDVGGSSGGGGSRTQQRSTATVLSWPGGRGLVVAAGLGIAGAAAWNLRKAITRSFLDGLDLSGRDERARRAIEVVGTVGYAARAWAFGLVAWFLVQAGLHRDPKQTQGLDGSLRHLADSSHGPLLLLALAIGLVLFGIFRIVDGTLRKPAELAWA